MHGSRRGDRLKEDSILVWWRGRQRNDTYEILWYKLTSLRPSRMCQASSQTG